MIVGGFFFFFRCRSFYFLRRLLVFSLFINENSKYPSRRDNFLYSVRAVRVGKMRFSFDKYLLNPDKRTALVERTRETRRKKPKDAIFKSEKAIDFDHGIYIILNGDYHIPKRFLQDKSIITIVKKKYRYDDGYSPNLCCVFTYRFH